MIWPWRRLLFFNKSNCKRDCLIVREVRDRLAGKAQVTCHVVVLTLAMRFELSFASLVHFVQ